MNRIERALRNGTRPRSFIERTQEEARDDYLSVILATRKDPNGITAREAIYELTYERFSGIVKALDLVGAADKIPQIDRAAALRLQPWMIADLRQKAEAIAAAKASSSGAFEEGKQAIFAAQDILIKAIPPELHPARIEQTKNKLDEVYTAVRKMPSDELKGDERTTLLDMVAVQKRLLFDIETAHQAAILSRDARVILDLNLIPSSQQAEVRRRIESVQKILKVSTPDKNKDIESANTGVVLLQDLGESPQFNENDIIISNGEIAKGVKHFIVDKGMTEDNALFVTPYLIAYARGLVSINNENYNTLIGKLDGLYRMIAKGPMPEALRDMLKKPDWTIANIIVAMIPDVEAYGQEYVERLQRQAWAALVAA